MNGDHPEMPDPKCEMRPRELLDAIKGWASGQGFTTEVMPSTNEYAKVIVRDPADGATYALIPNAHQGRRLRRDQVRYTIHHLNHNWKGA
jgi:hypothetical protein